MARKIWNSGLWWLTTSNDTVDYCRQCDLCQRISQPNECDLMLHQPVLPLQPFKKWDLDFVKPFKPATTKTGN